MVVVVEETMVAVGAVEVVVESVACLDVMRVGPDVVEEVRADEEDMEVVGTYEGVVVYEELEAGLVEGGVVSFGRVTFPSFRATGFLKGLSFTLPPLSVLDIFC